MLNEQTSARRKNAPHAPKTTNVNSDQPSRGFTATSTSLCNTAYQPTDELTIKRSDREATDFLLQLSVVAFHFS